MLAPAERGGPMRGLLASIGLVLLDLLSCAAPASPAPPAVGPGSAGAVPAVAEAAPAAPARLPLTASYSALVASQSPLWIAADAGLFERYGLDVTMPYISSAQQ